MCIPRDPFTAKGFLLYGPTSFFSSNPSPELSKDLLTLTLDVTVSCPERDKLLVEVFLTPQHVLPDTSPPSSVVMSISCPETESSVGGHSRRSGRFRVLKSTLNLNFYARDSRCHTVSLPRTQNKRKLFCDPTLVGEWVSH